MVMIIDLTDRVALVTGGGKGIGRACALTLARAGADVIVPDLDLVSAEKTRDDIKALGRKSTAIKADVSRVDDVDEVFEEGIQEFGHIDILVNNAGVGTSERRPFYEQTVEAWRRTIDVDLVGLWMCSRAAMIDMVKRKRGRIVNVASIAGKVALRLQADYDAAKAGVIKLTEVMAMEAAPYGVNVNAVAPGSTVTESTAALYADAAWREKMMKYIPLGRPAKVAEIADAVLYLSSDLSTYVTGHTLVVDGGWTAGAQIREI